MCSDTSKSNCKRLLRLQIFRDCAHILVATTDITAQPVRSVLANRLHSYRINTASLCKTDMSIALNSCHSLKHFKGCQKADWQGMLPVHLPRKVSSVGSPAGLDLSRERTSDHHLLKCFKHYSMDYSVSADFKKPLSSIRSALSFPTCQAVPLFCNEQLPSERTISHPVWLCWSFL